MNAQRVIVIGLVLASISPAQNILSGTVEPDGKARKLVATFYEHLPAAVVTGFPYSAEQVQTHTQTSPDGSRITKTFPSHLTFRDSQGRTRVENWVLSGPDGAPGMHIVEIRDCVAGSAYTLDTENRVAHRSRIPSNIKAQIPVVIRIDGPQTSLRATKTIDDPTSVTQSLGMQVLEGSSAGGTRLTTTIPMGMQGNEQPLVSTSETWVAQDLNLVVLSKRNSAKDGETVTKLININRTEPDQALFQVPPTYRIVDEKGTFTIEVTRLPRAVKASREDEESISRMLGRFADARTTLDATGMAAAYAADAEFIAFSARPLVGRPAIDRDLIGPVTKGGGRMERSIKGVRLIWPDLAVVEGDVHFRGPNGNMDFIEHYVLRKDASHWQILFQRYVHSE
jgi:ketosteroid isomerase-like protein